MRFALCDSDQLYTSMVEIMLNNLGHEVIGVATTEADSTALIAAARPDAVILGLPLTLHSDFDVPATATTMGAVTIIFAERVDDALLGHYAVRPTVVFKPHLTDLERAVGRLGLSATNEVLTDERRDRPWRDQSGSGPTKISDPQDFYAGLNDAAAGDALLAIELGELDAEVEEASVAAVRVRTIMRGADRLLLSPGMLRLYLPGAGSEGVRSFRSRLADAGALPGGAVVRWVVVGDGEDPADAFDRLKTTDPS